MARLPPTNIGGDGRSLDRRDPSLEASRSGPYHALLMTYAEISLMNGDVFTVEGALEEVEKRISDAARSGQSRLAWFTLHDGTGAVGINPIHVAALRSSEGPESP